MMRSRWIILVGLALLFFVGCNTTSKKGSLKRFEYAELHMGTVFRIVLYAPEQSKADLAAVAAFQRIVRLDEVMSDYDPKSELMLLCDKPAGVPVKVSQDLFDILRESQVVARESEGAFDVTVGPYVRLWRAARKKKVLPSPAELAEAAKAVGYRKLVINEEAGTVTLSVPNMKLDLGGIAKGYAADQALGVMRQMGVSRAMVAASGDIAVGEPPPGHAGWAIGISSVNPQDKSVFKTVLLKNAGISTSGDLEQGIEINGIRYSHVINPATGLGLTNRIQATVISSRAMITDGLDNTVCALGVQRGLALIDSLPGTAALVVTREKEGMQVFISRRFSHLHFQN